MADSADEPDDVELLRGCIGRCMAG